MYITNKTIIYIPTDLSFSLTINNILIIISIIAKLRLPKNVKGFLPTLIKTNTAIIVENTLKPFMINGTLGASYGIAFSTIFLAEVTIALIPVICCIKGN